MLHGSVYLLASFWGYPFGGGEEYLYQTAQWTHQIGMKNYWMCFANSKNEPFRELRIINHKYFRLIQIPGGLTENTLYNWLKILKPDIVHHQGHLRKFFYSQCEILKIPFISGFHFWTGAIILDGKTRNIDILEHAENHRPDPEIYDLVAGKYCTLYVVSKFVHLCIKAVTGIDIPNMIYSGSSPAKCLVENNNIYKNKYVTVINIHLLKGGELVLRLLRELTEIPFMVVQTEHNSETLDNEIEKTIRERNRNGSAVSMFMQRVDNPRVLYAQTKIFLAPSLVDETFCRTVNEAMMNGIPVITTGQGNLKYLVSDPHFLRHADDYDGWKNRIRELYHDDVELKAASQKMNEMYQEYSDVACKNMFMSCLENTLAKSRFNNIMILSPWCDQGLGIQSRNYYNILTDAGFNVAVFSIKPYMSNSALDLQKKPAEWAIERVYYSSNDREHITDTELSEFIDKYNIGKCIIPETCWFRIFEVAKFLRQQNVRCYAIPNIEIVRKDEIFKHTYFHKILCNNRLCETLFNKHGIYNTAYIGYGILNPDIEVKQKIIRDKTKFLFIGGMNAFSRKHILEICEGFVMAYVKNENIHLTCTIQHTNLLELEDKNKIETYMSHPGITFIQDHLPYEKIIGLYYDHHISIQVSKHEGLGLGFYEALNTGTPVITLDTPPHNEIIVNGKNGWIIPCYYKKMTDNQDSLIDSAYFHPSYLADKIVEITSSEYDLVDVFRNLYIDLHERIDYSTFKSTFVRELST